MKNGKQTVVFLIFLAMMIFAGWKLFGIFSEYKEGEDTYEQVAEEFTEQEEETVSVSFEELLAQYPDVVGWIYCEGTPIDYPIVKGGDNDYYLKRMYNGSYNGNGSIFMDYRNQSDFSDWNTIIYGHNMDNDAMFGVLTDYQKQSFYEAHPEMQLLTPEKEYRIDLVGGFVVPASSEIYGFPITEASKEVLLEKACTSSTFVSGVEVLEDEKLITLSTCTYNYDDARYVVVGVLRELPVEEVTDDE